MPTPKKSPEQNCTESPEQNCTDSPIAESVQPADPRDVQILPENFVQVQIFRARLRHYLEGEKPLIVGNRWHPRALVLPVPQFWGESAKRKMKVRLRKQLEELMKELI